VESDGAQHFGSVKRVTSQCQVGFALVLGTNIPPDVGMFVIAPPPAKGIKDPPLLA
jgi:hypothetical protein